MSEEITEDALYDMSDEDLEAAFQEAKASLNDEIVDEPVEDVVVNESVEAVDEPTVDDVVEDVVEVVTEEPVVESEEVTEEVIDDKVEVTSEDKEIVPEEVVEPVVEEIKEPSKHKVKANGSEFDFTVDELVTLAPKAMDYTKKMQEIAPWRKTISALQENELGQDDVNLMIEAIKGDKDAITSLIKKAGIDTLELDTEAELEYTPKDYGLSENQLDIRDIESKISNDVEYVKTTNVVNNEWDSASQQELFKQPAMIEALHIDVKSGVYDVVSKMATKQKLLNPVMGMSDLDYYRAAGQVYTQDKARAEVAEQEALKAEQERQATYKAEQDAIALAKATAQKQEELKAQAANRKAAAPTGKTAGQKTVIDYLEDNDEKYDEWYKKLQASL